MFFGVKAWFAHHLENNNVVNAMLFSTKNLLQKYRFTTSHVGTLSWKSQEWDPPKGIRPCEGIINHHHPLPTPY